MKRLLDWLIDLFFDRGERYSITFVRRPRNSNPHTLHVVVRAHSRFDAAAKGYDLAHATHGGYLEVLSIDRMYNTYFT